MSVFTEAFWQMFGWTVGFFTGFATILLFVLAGGMASALVKMGKRRLNALAPKRDNVEEFRPERRR